MDPLEESLDPAGSKAEAGQTGKVGANRRPGWRTFRYLSLVPPSCVVPSWYRMSMVESEERPLSRPNSRGLFRSTATAETVIGQHRGRSHTHKLRPHALHTGDQTLQ